MTCQFSFVGGCQHGEFSIMPQWLSLKSSTPRIMTLDIWDNVWKNALYNGLTVNALVSCNFLGLCHYGYNSFIIAYFAFRKSSKKWKCHSICVVCSWMVNSTDATEGTPCLCIGLISWPLFCIFSGDIMGRQKKTYWDKKKQRRNTRLQSSTPSFFFKSLSIRKISTFPSCLPSASCWWCPLYCFAIGYVTDYKASHWTTITKKKKLSVIL